MIFVYGIIFVVFFIIDAVNAFKIFFVALTLLFSVVFRAIRTSLLTSAINSAMFIFAALEASAYFDIIVPITHIPP